MILSFTNTNDMDKINVLFGIILSVCVVSCGNSLEKKQIKEKTIELLNIDTSQNQIVINEEGIFLELSYLDSSRYLAKWGDGKMNFSKDTVLILSEGNAHATILQNKGIYIQQGCGSSCFFGYVLSLSNNEAMHYSYPLLVSLELDLIAYNGDDTENLVIVENFINHKRQKIKADFLPGIFPGHSIDSISFTTERKLFLNWLNSDEETQQQTFELTDLK